MSDTARYLRQMRLVEVGERGQARLLAASVEVHLSGAAARVAERYLVGAGVGSVRHAAAAQMPTDDANTALGVDALRPGPRELAAGSLAALGEIRRILDVQMNK